MKTRTLSISLIAVVSVVLSVFAVPKDKPKPEVKEGAILLNIGRGLLIDDTALMAALDEGRLATAVLDVFHTEPLPADDKLWTHPKIRATSHTSFAGGGGATRWKELFLDNLQRFVQGEALVNEVNPNDIP